MKTKDIYPNFDELAQGVWAAQTLEKKKELCRQMVDQFRYKEKQNQFYREIDRATNKTRLDRMAADLMQLPHGNRVVS